MLVKLVVRGRVELPTFRFSGTVTFTGEHSQGTQYAVYVRHQHFTALHWGNECPAMRARPEDPIRSQRLNIESTDVAIGWNREWHQLGTMSLSKPVS